MTGYRQCCSGIVCSAGPGEAGAVFLFLEILFVVALGWDGWYHLLGIHSSQLNWYDFVKYKIDLGRLVSKVGMETSVCRNFITVRAVKSLQCNEVLLFDRR